MNIPLRLSAAGITRLLLYGLGSLLLLNLAAAFFHTVLHMRAAAFSQLFDMDQEANMPTFYNCFLFFVGALLFMLLGNTVPVGKARRGWYLMAAVFGFLGVDEGSQVHEKFMLVTLRLLHHGQQSGTDFGWFYYAWVIPYGLAAIVLVLTLSRWLIALDPKLRTGLFVSGTIYVFGAVFMEMFSGKIADGYTAMLTPAEQAYIPCEIYEANTCHLYAHWGYIAAYTVEETCEMLGLILCAHALLKAIERRQLRFDLVIGSEA